MTAWVYLEVCTSCGGARQRWGLTWHILAACIIKATGVHFRDENVWELLRLPPEQQMQCFGGSQCGVAATGQAAAPT